MEGECLARMEISEWFNREEKNGQRSVLILTVISVELLKWYGGVIIIEVLQ